MGQELHKAAVIGLAELNTSPNGPDNCIRVSHKHDPVRMDAQGQLVVNIGFDKITENPLGNCLPTRRATR